MTTSVTDHYQTHLAPIYVWMAGGLDAAVERGGSELAEVLPGLSAGTTVLDLGAGFGMHAIPLARLGCSVIALDSSARMLQELSRHTVTLPVKVIEGDLLSFPRHLDTAVDVILIMGDTLTHLADRACVQQLFLLAAASLRQHGKFIATFRDYTTPLVGNERFILVRSDAERILSCFLEYGADSVEVHDVLLERQSSGWRQRVSAYRKLRLSPEWVSKQLRAAGFSVQRETGMSGMVRIIATRI
jgi:SAM-dependent methyltransferase